MSDRDNWCRRTCHRHTSKSEEVAIPLGQGLAGCGGLRVLCLNWGSFCCCAACSFYVAGCVHHPFSLLADFPALFMWLGCSNCRDWQRGRAGLGCIPCRKERHQCCCCVAVLQMMLRYVYPERSVYVCVAYKLSESLLCSFCGLV